MVLAGIECSPKIRDFRASGIPDQERVDFFDTLPYGNAARSKIADFRTALPALAVPKENNRLEREFSLTAAP